MAIALRGTGVVGPNSNGTSTSISLPAGITAGDVSIILFKSASGKAVSGTIPTMTPPAGWTVLYSKNGNVVVYRVYVGGDPTSGITCTSSAGDWWESACVAYSGCDTSNPIDQFVFCNANFIAATFGFSRNFVEAPSVQASYNGGQYVGLFASGGPGSSGNTLGTPSGLTSRAASGSGPSVKIADLALTDGTPTGPYQSSRSSLGADNLFGASLILKASGAAGATLAATRPVVGGFNNTEAGGSTSYTLLLDYLDVQDGDLVIFFASGPVSVSSPPAGYSAVSGQVAGSANAYSHSWATGDTKSPTFTLSATTSREMCTVLLRKSGSSATNPTIDQSSSNSVTASGANTVSPPSLTPANAAELLLLYWGEGVGTSGAWSSQPTLTVFEDPSTSNCDQNCGYKLPAASPTGTINNTWTRSGGGSDTVTALAILVTIAAGGGGGASASIGNFLIF